MERLATLPRGGGPMGFYEQPAQHVPIRRVRGGRRRPDAERIRLEVLRTDTATSMRCRGAAQPPRRV